MHIMSAGQGPMEFYHAKLKQEIKDFYFILLLFFTTK